MPAVSQKNYALQLAAASDLGLGGQLMQQATEVADKLKKKKQQDMGSLAADLGLE